MYLTSLADLEVALDTGAVTAKSLLCIQESTGAPFRWHPLGFISCTLLAHGSKKVRLHYWPVNTARAQDAQCQIHDHIFDFSSWVMAGTVENIQYKKDNAGDIYSLYETQYTGEVSILKRTAETSCLSVESVC